MLPLVAGARFVVDVRLAPTESNLEVTISERRLDEGGMVKEKNVKELRMLPSTTGNLESVLPHIALGTNMGSGGELSSQYQVRGGNYDENLVYVNDFEIYRPQLIRAGQQEGLTFANLDLVRDLSFSSGGFQAKYGDKLSSVLDIKYKRPDSLRASANASLLGGSAHLEGSIRSRKHTYRTLRYLFGARYKTTRLLLGSLDVKGEYVPNFSDIQAYLTYDLNRDWQVGLISNLTAPCTTMCRRACAAPLGLLTSPCSCAQLSRARRWMTLPRPWAAFRSPTCLSGSGTPCFTKFWPPLGEARRLSASTYWATTYWARWRKISAPTSSARS